MGTMVVAYPALRKARELHPDATLHFLCFTQIRPSVEMLEIIPSGNIITVDPHSVLSLARDTLRFLWRARVRRIARHFTRIVAVPRRELPAHSSSRARCSLWSTTPTPPR